jgi:hypothetical protein
MTERPTRDERLAGIAAAKEQAEQLAADFQAAAGVAGAGEAERLRAETALLIVENAETKAGLIDRAEAEHRLAEVAQWGAEAERG